MLKSCRRKQESTDTSPGSLATENAMKKFIIPIVLAMLIIGGIVYTIHYVNEKPVGEIFAAASNVEINEEEVPGLQSPAEQGDKVAQYKLALAYSIGKGVPQDYAQATNWAQKSAEQG